MSPLEVLLRSVADIPDRLKEEKKTWITLTKPPPQVTPLFQDLDSAKAPLPDETLLDVEEAEMLRSLTDKSSAFVALRSQTQSRLQILQASLEFKIDHLADSIHKLDERAATASREADKVLNASAARLKEREDKEKGSVGTKDVPVMEVLRSLGKILPDGGG